MMAGVRITWEQVLWCVSVQCSLYRSTWSLLSTTLERIVIFSKESIQVSAALISSKYQNYSYFLHVFCSLSLLVMDMYLSDKLKVKITSNSFTEKYLNGFPNRNHYLAERIF